MKKQFIYLALLPVTGIIFSSCGSLSKMSFTKRHYRSGYYVDFGGRNHTPHAPSNTAAITVREKHQTPQPVIVTKPNSIIAAPVNEQKATVVKYAAPQKNIIRKKEEENSNKNVSNISTTNSFVQNSSIYASANHNNESESEVDVRVNADIPFIIILLCAIFIPPLGVALMYGIHTYFWVDLILTLLFFIPGMIFALIVVLM